MSQLPSLKTYAVIERVREPQRDALRAAVLCGLARAYLPPPKTTVSQWADTYRFLSPEAAALSGKWKTSKEPMAKGVMDAFSDPMTEKVTAMCAAQILKTEALLNVAGHFIHGDPAPILMVQPTVEMAEAFSKDRVAPMIRDTPVLRAIFNTKSRDSGDTILQKAFPGGRLNMTGANAPATLASRPIRIVLCDEVDRFPVSAGKEGDPVSLAEKRTTTFWNRKIGLVSTPTIKGESRIEASYSEGDRRKFYVPCPHCGVRQVLSWKGVKWGKDEKGEHDPDTAHYECQTDEHDPHTGEFGCGKPWTESERYAAIAEAGKLADGGWIAEREFKGHASFHASQLASKRVPLHRIVKEFLEAKPYPDRLKTWTNTVLAETWEDGGEKVDPATLYGRREDYGPDMLPAKVGMVVAAVDIQDNRWECELVGWGANEERWSLDYVVHYADPSTPGYWEALDDTLLRTLPHPTGAVLKVEATCIDSGGHHTQAVYDFTRPRFSRRVFAIKGIAGPNKPIWPKKATRNVAKKTDVFIIGVDQAKSVMQARFLIPSPDGGAEVGGPGFCHFPRRDVYDEAYFAGLTVEKAITKYKQGHPYKVWVCPDGKRNEPWDNAVYAYAALKSTPVDIKARLAALHNAAEARKRTNDPLPPPAVGKKGRRVLNRGAQA
jgi:phage terminase large subunit GpA-like protein